MSAKATVQKINIDLPSWVVKELDKKSKAYGIPRKSLINVILVDAINPKSKNAKNAYPLLQLSSESLSKEWLSEEDEDAFKKL